MGGFNNNIRFPLSGNLAGQGLGYALFSVRLAPNKRPYLNWCATAFCEHALASLRRSLVRRLVSRAIFHRRPTIAAAYQTLRPCR